jgi:hypothetical protein
MATMDVRYSYRMRTSRTAERSLLTEWDRDRWVWNQCTARSKKLRRAAGVMTRGDPVQVSSASTTVRAHNGSVERTPGPFSPGGEQIIGFYLLECASDAEAIGWAAKIPAAKYGAVEVRPILVQE